MTSSRVRAVAALSVIGVLVLAGGCGSDDEGGGDSDFAKQSGDKIAADAKADMKALDEVKFSGEITSEGDTITLDVQASSAGDCTGSIGIGGGTAEILAKDGTNWFKPDEAFWRANAADSADAIISAVGDKWVLDTDSNFSQFCDLDAFFDNLFKDEESSGEYKTTGTDEIDGQEVVKVEQSDDEGTSVGYVAHRRRPLPAEARAHRGRRARPPRVQRLRRGVRRHRTGRRRGHRPQHRAVARASRAPGSGAGGRTPARRVLARPRGAGVRGGHRTVDARLAEQPGAEIRAAVEEAMAGVTSLRYRIKIGNGAEAETVDVRATSAGACTGTPTCASSRTCWTACWAPRRRAGWFVTGTDEVAGQPVVLLQNTNSGNGAALASALVDEPHYLVALQRTDDTDGTVGRTTFSEFGEQVDATAPAPNEVVDLSSFLG